MELPEYNYKMTVRKTKKVCSFSAYYFYSLDSAQVAFFLIYQSNNPYLPCTGYWVTAAFIH